MTRSALLALFIAALTAAVTPVSAAENADPGAVPAQAATEPEAAADEEIVDEMIPPSEEDMQDLVGTAMADDEFSTFVAMLQSSDLMELLRGGPYTVFAPTNDAFAALPSGKVAELMKPENKDELINIISYHIISGVETSGTIPDGASEPSTVQGTTLNIVKSKDQTTVDGAHIVTADIPASNGVIHAIDKVMMP